MVLNCDLYIRGNDAGLCPVYQGRHRCCWALYIGDGIEMVLGCALNREERHSGYCVVFCMLRGGTEMVPSIGISMCPNC